MHLRAQSEYVAVGFLHRSDCKPRSLSALQEKEGIQVEQFLGFDMMRRLEAMATRFLFVFMF